MLEGMNDLIYRQMYKCDKTNVWMNHWVLKNVYVSSEPLTFLMCVCNNKLMHLKLISFVKWITWFNVMKMQSWNIRNEKRISICIKDQIETALFVQALSK